MGGISITTILAANIAALGEWVPESMVTIINSQLDHLSMMNTSADGF